jgi:aromatic-L-amino-acid decarboxylase
MKHNDSPLELNGEQLQELVAAAMDRIIPHIDSLHDQPSADIEGAAELARSLVEPIPQQPSSLNDVLDLVFETAVPKSFNTAGPGYLAYIPGGGIPHAAVADLIAAAVNRYVGVWVAAPGLAQLEANVVRWLCEIMGYGPDSLGFLTSGGSLANFSAIVTARRSLLPEDFLRGTIYVSDQVHHSVQKAAMLAGFPADAVREIGSDEVFRIQLDELSQRIAEDQAGGRTPFLIVGSAGTTNTGAVDDLERLADIAAHNRMWLHVDGAYGGFFMLTQRGRAAMSGIERADSIVLDPHKGMFLPYGTGCLLVRDGSTLRRAHTVFADYMPAMQDEGDLVDFCQISPELSRPFRGLAVWLPIKLFGIQPFAENLDEKLDLAKLACDRLRLIDGLEILAEPQLSIVAFRLTRPGLDTPAVNELNRKLMAGVNARKRVYLTGTMLGDRFAIRICVLSFRTHEDRMEMALEDIKGSVDALRT